MVSTDTQKQNSLATIVVDYGISKTAEKLGYSYAYVHQVINGKMELTDNMKKRIENLTPRTRVANVIDWPDTKEGRANRDKVKLIPMAERRRKILK